MKMMFLVDGENNVNEGLTGIKLLSKEDSVLIFYQNGNSLTKIKKVIGEPNAYVEYIESATSKSSKNSIDFQITAELGVLLGKNEVEGAYIISHDKGYAAAIAAMRKRYAKNLIEIDVRKSILECLKLSFVLKATTKNELSSALVKEYGNTHGSYIYNHLKSIFTKSNECLLSK